MFCIGGLSMKRSFFLYSNGTLKRKDNTITFINEKDEKRDIPIEMVDDFYVMSEMNFNTKFINYISQFGIPIHFFNYYTFYTGSFYPREMNISGQLLVKQVEHYTNEQKRVEIAREFIEGASFNIYRNLRYYNGRGKDLKFYMDQIEELRKYLKEVNNVDELMGYEGNIRKIYYEAWNIIVNQEIDFEKRVKNPPDNMINSLISFVNTLFYTKVLGEIYKTQLNPTVSYLHQPSTRRFSLSLDISELSIIFQFFSITPCGLLGVLSTSSKLPSVINFLIIIADLLLITCLPKNINLLLATSKRIESAFTVIIELDETS